MSTYFWFLYVILIIAVPVGLFAIAYFLVKKAVKNGILEAYKEIHKEP